MVNIKTKEEIRRLSNEPRGVFTGKEFRKMVVVIIEETGISELPSEVAMEGIIKYLSFVSPKMSLPEFRLAFEMLNTMQMNVYLDKPLLFNIRLTSQVVNEYHRTRQLTLHENRVYAKPPEHVPVQLTSEQWLTGLKSFIETHSALPFTYRWLSCIDALIQQKTITEDDLLDAEAEVIIHLNKQAQYAISKQERIDINKTIANPEKVRSLAAKELIQKLYRENKL